MDKKEILKRAQKEKADERRHQVKIKSFYVGWIGAAIMITIFAIMQYQLNDFQITSDINVIVTTNLSALSFYRYKHLKNISSLLTVIMCLMAVGLSFAALLSRYGVY